MTQPWWCAVRCRFRVTRHQPVPNRSRPTHLNLLSCGTERKLADGVARFDRSWLKRLITQRVPMSGFADAMNTTEEGVNIVIDLNSQTIAPTETTMTEPSPVRKRHLNNDSTMPAGRPPAADCPAPHRQVPRLTRWRASGHSSPRARTSSIRRRGRVRFLRPGIAPGCGSGGPVVQPAVAGPDRVRDVDRRGGGSEGAAQHGVGGALHRPPSRHRRVRPAPERTPACRRGSACSISSTCS